MHTDPKDAVREALDGGHVAHVTNGKRTIAIRPCRHPGVKWTATYGLTTPLVNLTQRDEHGPEISGDVLVENAERVIRMMLGRRYVVHADRPYFTAGINQGWRDCEITSLKRTRARVEYEMPNAGLMGCWWNYAQVGEYILLD